MFQVEKEIPVVLGTVTFGLHNEKYERIYVLPIQTEDFTGEKSLEIQDVGDEESYLKLINSDKDIVYNFDYETDRFLVGMDEIISVNFTQVTESRHLGIFQVP